MIRIPERISNIALRLLLNAVRRENERLRENNETLLRMAATYKVLWRRLLLTRSQRGEHRTT